MATEDAAAPATTSDSETYLAELRFEALVERLHTLVLAGDCAGVKRVLAASSASSSSSSSSSSASHHHHHPAGGVASQAVDGSLPLHTALTGTGAHSADMCLALLKSFPQACSVPDEMGQLPLHVALAYRQPARVVEALLEAYPGASRVCDRHQWSPLLIALKAQAGEGVCRLVFAADRAFGATTGAPSPGPDDDAVSAAGVSGSAMLMPLHAAVGSDVGDAFVRDLLLECPEAAGVPSASHRCALPLRVAIESHREEDTLLALLRAYPNAARAMNDKGWTMLHSGLYYDASPNVLTALLGLWPAASGVQASDSAGYPLHVALARMAPPAFIMRLLQVNGSPASAPVPCVNATPSFPLHIAARWGTSKEVVSKLIELFPKAVSVQGGDETLLPHKIAAQRGKREIGAVMQDALRRWQRRHLCQVCNLPATLRCSRCKQVWYCTKACQKMGWKEHRVACAGSAGEGRSTSTEGAGADAGGGGGAGAGAGAGAGVGEGVADTSTVSVMAGPPAPVSAPATASTHAPSADASGTLARGMTAEFLRRMDQLD